MSHGFSDDPMLFPTINLVFPGIYTSNSDFRKKLSGDCLLAALHSLNKCKGKPGDRGVTLRRSILGWVLKGFPEEAKAQSYETTIIDYS